MRFLTISILLLSFCLVPVVSRAQLDQPGVLAVLGYTNQQLVYQPFEGELVIISDLGVTANVLRTFDNKLWVVHSGDFATGDGCELWNASFAELSSAIDQQRTPEWSIIELTNFSNPYDMLISGDRIFVSLLASNSVAVLDRESGDLISMLGGFNAPEGLLECDLGIAVANSGYGYGSSVFFLNPDDLEITDSLTVGENPQWMVKDSLGRLHILCSGRSWGDAPVSGEVVRFDPVTGETEIVELEGNPGEIILLSDPQDERIVLGDEWAFLTPHITAYQAETMLPDPALEEDYPGGGALAYSTGEVYIASSSNPSIAKIQEDWTEYQLLADLEQPVVDLLAYSSSRTQTVELAGHYFELVSSGLIPLNPDAVEVFGSIEGLGIVYQDDGGIFLPPALNTIGEMDVREAYRIYCTQPSQWYITGNPVDPETVFSLDAGQWNWVGYPLEQEMAVTTALDEIQDVVRIVMNDEGLIWIPGLVNTLQTLCPGEGYTIYSDEPVDFTFRQDEELFSLRSLRDRTAANFHDIQPTGLPWPILLRFDASLHNDRPTLVEAYDGSRLVGRCRINDKDSITVLIAWEGNSEQGLDGFHAGNRINLKMLNENGKEIEQLVISGATTFRGSIYGELQVNHPSLPEKFTVSSAYPNPFNNQCRVTVTLPERGSFILQLFNIVGEEVRTIPSAVQEAGHYEVSVDSHGLASGIYFLVAEFQSSRVVQRVVLLQ